MTVEISMTDNIETAAYRKHIAGHTDYPAVSWDSKSRHLEFQLPTHMGLASCWSLRLAQRHALLAGLVAASQDSDWRCFHAAMSVLSDRRSLVVIGPSGAGKSTLVRRLGADARGDEIVAIRHTNGAVSARGTAVPGELRCEDFSEQPLAAFILPDHGPSQKVCVTRLSPAQSLEHLLAASIRFSSEAILSDWDWLEGLIHNIPVLRVSWNLIGELPLPAILAELNTSQR
ncbi:MAG: hypothetical protein OSB21_09645 [Myxococcota bacterium]|nr:hypothetical protein [Myxococcota bacterium]